MRIARSFLSLAAAAFLIAGCADQQAPAENALSKVEASLSEVRADAEKYAAEQLASVDDSVKNLKSNMERKDYRAVIMGAPSVASAIADLKAKVTQAKADAEATLAAAQSEWNDLSSSVPPMVDALTKRVGELAKTRKLPKDMDKAAFDAAKSGVEELKTEWTEAGTEFAEGKAAEALREARAAKARGAELLEQLGAKVG